MKKFFSVMLGCLYMMLTVFNSFVFADSDNLTISVGTERTSPVFYENETAKFRIEFFNGSNTRKSCNIEYKIVFKNYNYDSYKQEVDEVVRKEVKGESAQLNPQESFEDALYFDMKDEKYGIYSLYVTVRDEAEKKYEKQFSFAKSTVSEKLNKTFGASLHLTRYADSDTTFGLMKNAGLGLARDDFNWDKYEKSKGEYKLDERQTDTLEKAKRYGIEMLAIMTGYNKIYCQNAKYSGIPDDSVYDETSGATYADAYKNYVSSFINEPIVKNTVSMIEVINEPLGVIKDGNTTDYPMSEQIPKYIDAGGAYSNAVKAAYAAVQENDSPIKVGAFSAFRLGYQADYFIDGAMNEMDKQYYDAFTIHDYKERGFDGDPEPGFSPKMGRNWFPFLDGAVSTVEHFDDLMSGKTAAPYTKRKYTGFSNGERWYTERGFSTDDKPDNSTNYSQNPYYDQALNLVRAKIVTDAYSGGNMIDKTWIYDFSDDPESRNLGIRESSFGIVESHEDENPYAAKPAYIAVANYNSLVADATKCEKIDGDDIYEENGDYIYKYTCPEREVYALYHSKGDDPSETLELEFSKIGEGREIHIYDFWGNEMQERYIYKDGKYQLTKQPFYICVGKNVNRSLKPEKGAGTIENVVLDGFIASKQSGKKVSVIVASDGIDKDELSPLNALYFNQCTTDNDGYFCFEFGVPKQPDGYRAYVTSEDCEVPLSFDIADGRTEKISIFLMNGILKLKADDFKMVDLSNVSAAVEYTAAGRDIPYRLYCSLYKGDRLVGFTSIFDKVESMTDGNKVYSVSFPKDGDNTYPEFDRISLFMFDSDETLKPVCTAYTINKNN